MLLKQVYFIYYIVLYYENNSMTKLNQNYNEIIKDL